MVIDTGVTRPSRREVIGLVVLVAVLAVLWGRAAGTALWADEGISTGVASHSLTSIPRLVVEESSPPLYYMLLHVWASALGWSDTATHALSLVFALATVPAAVWAGWSLFGRRAGWIAAVLMAISPYLAYYANETRMYSLVAFLAVPAVAAYVHAFVFGRRRHLPLFVASLALLLYTHNWALFLGAAAAMAVVPLVVIREDRRRVVVDAALAFGAVAVLYAPWVPSLLDQVGQGLQPWGIKATLEVVRDEAIHLLGGRYVFSLLGLGVGLGVAAVVEARRWSRDVVAMAVLAGVVAVVLVLGWRTSVWTHRYLAVVLAPVVLVLAGGLARGGRVATAALGVAVFLGAPLGVKGPPHQKSNARAVVAAVSPSLRPGDLVIVADPHILPLIAHYMPPGLRYATASGLVVDEKLVEWRGFMDRLASARPAVTLASLIAALPPGAHVVVLCPPSGADDPPPAGLGTASSASSAPTTPVEFDELRVQRCVDTIAFVAGRPDLREDARYTAPEGVRLTAVDGRLLTKLAAA